MTVYHSQVFASTFARFRAQLTGPKCFWASILTGLLLSISPVACARQPPGSAMQEINPAIGGPFPIDLQRVEDQGLKIVRGRHIDLFSDLPDQDRLASLAEVFDAAVPCWCRLFRVDASMAKPWRIRAFLMANRGDVSRFRKAGLITDVPGFEAGFQRDHNVWLFAQRGDYYTRHLLLHEGTHAFMQWFTKGYGAPWYSEGMAELIGLHRWDPEAKTKLVLQQKISDSSEADYWGRVKLIRTDKANNKRMNLDEVLQIPSGAFREVRYYAWSWAACEFLSRHPETKEAFANLKTRTTLPPTQFNQTFREAIAGSEVSWAELSDHWELFIDEIDYGYLVERGVPKPARTLNGTVFAIKTDQSWQVALQVKKGQRWKITGKGDFSVGDLVAPVMEAESVGSKTFVLSCGAGGVTAFHYRGRPLGELHAGVWPFKTQPSTRNTSLLIEPVAVGADSVVEIKHDGMLCLRINESPAKLADNKGALEVFVKQLQ